LPAPGEIDDVEEVVGKTAALHCVGFGSPHINFAVHSNGIAVHDLAVEPLRQTEGEPGLSAAGGPQDDQKEGVRFATRILVVGCGEHQRALQGI
jgi:hypothetical protein